MFFEKRLPKGSLARKLFFLLLFKLVFLVFLGRLFKQNKVHVSPQEVAQKLLEN